MSLQEFLQQKPASDFSNSFQANDSAAQQDFAAAAAQDVFNDVIEPSISRVAETFTSNGFAARKGQAVEPGGYAFSENAVSLSVFYKNISAQWDFYADELMSKVTVRFIHASAAHQTGGGVFHGVDRHYDPAVINLKLIEEIIEEDLGRTALNHPADSQSIAQEVAQGMKQGQ